MKLRVNYIYFGLFFALLSLLCASNMLMKEPMGGSFFFFLFYAAGQALIETFCLIGITLFCERFLGKRMFKFWIGLSFLLVFFHISDFLMDRILDLSVVEAFDLFVLQEDLDHFFLLLDASGVSLGVWGLLFLCTALLPALGIFLYSLSEKLSLKRPLFPSKGHFFQAFFCIPAALSLWDFSASQWIPPDSYTNFRKSLPWKRTFLTPQTTFFSLKHPIRTPQEESISSWIEQDQTVLTHKPNIYLVIAESLREDFITEETAPFLTQFKKEFTSFERAFSAGNGTHLSWFSIFFSEPSIYWKFCETNFHQGSPALRLLKKWGYKIRLYTSAHLGYYNMKELLFGKNASLLDSQKTFHHAPPLSAADSDAFAVQAIHQDLQENPSLREGQLILLFLDSTHFDYSWPKNWSPKFTPYAKETAYFKIFHSAKSIQSIKHRYMSSVNYLDHLFSLLMKATQPEDIVIFAGDHGEEFFDHGHLFHNSHLSQEQVHVPIYFKFQENRLNPQMHSLISHLDIFPTVIDYLGKKQLPMLQGESLFRKKASPYALSARFNAGRPPYEMRIDQGEYQMIAQFSNRKDIFLSKKLKIVSLKTKNGMNVGAPDPQSWIEQTFGPSFSLFSQAD